LVDKGGEIAWSCSADTGTCTDTREDSLGKSRSLAGFDFRFPLQIILSRPRPQDALEVRARAAYAAFACGVDGRIGIGILPVRQELLVGAACADAVSLG
jgi:hypothetical protein